MFIDITHLSSQFSTDTAKTYFRTLHCIFFARDSPTALRSPLNDRVVRYSTLIRNLPESQIWSILDHIFYFDSSSHRNSHQMSDFTYGHLLPPVLTSVVLLDARRRDMKPPK